MKVLDRNTKNEDYLPIADKLNAMQTEIDSISRLLDDKTGSLLSKVQNIESNLSVLVNKIETDEIGLDELATGLKNLAESLMTLVSTDEIQTNSVTSTMVSAEGIQTESIHSDQGNFERFTAISCDATEINAENVFATKIKALTLELSELFLNVLKTEKVTTDNLEAIELIAGIATVARVNSQLYTVEDDSSWRTPTGTPDNASLLKITFPKYHGTIRVVTQQNEFDFTIFDNTLLTFQQSNSLYIYRIEFFDDRTEIYFTNVADTISYKEIWTGSDDIEESFSEIVPRSGIDANITTLKGTISSEAILSGDLSTLSLVVVDRLPDVGAKNVIYAIDRENSYVWDNSRNVFVEMAPKIRVNEKVYESFPAQMQLKTAQIDIDDNSHKAFEGNLYLLKTIKNLPQGLSKEGLIYVNGGFWSYSEENPFLIEPIYALSSKVETNKNLFNSLNWQTIEPFNIKVESIKIETNKGIAESLGLSACENYIDNVAHHLTSLDYKNAVSEAKLEDMTDINLDFVRV